MAKNKSSKIKENKGQVMLLSVMVLSGAILSISAIAGLLTLYQIRQANDIGNSTKSIFAADSGIEFELYKFFKNPTYIAQPMTNGTSFETFADGTTSIRSIGSSSKTSRAFELFWQSATATLP
ncbi:MAG: hypothetical protein AAB560_00465 [Patescibacteria group bacterium]